MKPVITLQSVSKTYGDIIALDKVKLEILEGEVLSLLGPNGSGKTTLMRILAGIEKSTSGQMYFKDAVVNESNLDRLRSEVTMVFQKTALFSTSVYENIAYGLKLRELSKKDTAHRVREVIKKVRLEGYEKRQAKKLSGGEQQRVSLARALVLEPEVLLLDEPTANIDPKNASIIEDVLKTIGKRKKTIVIATQNMAQVENLASRAAVLNRGRMERIGRFQEVFKSPSKFLADFARLENIFQGISRITQEGTSIINVGEELDVEAAFRESGNTTIYVRPEDIILSTQPLISSARNTFRGKITEITDLGPVVKLKVKAGKDFTVQVTKRSFNEMQLNLDSSVFLAFKASSVQVI